MLNLKTKDAIKVHIRWAIRRDMPEILQIENEAFGHLAWNEEDFLKCLRQRNCIGMVGEHGEAVFGYMVYELHKHKLHILNLAVKPSMMRREIGTQMINKLRSKLSTHRRQLITLTVRDDNLPAQLFLKSQNFECFNFLRNYYEDGADGYEFRYILPGELKRD